MRRQLVPGLVVRLTVIKAKTRPGIEASRHTDTLPYTSLAHAHRGIIIPFTWQRINRQSRDGRMIMVYLLKILIRPVTRHACTHEIWFVNLTTGIAGNFRGVKYSLFSWASWPPRNFNVGVAYRNIGMQCSHETKRNFYSQIPPFFELNEFFTSRKLPAIRYRPLCCVYISLATVNNVINKRVMQAMNIKKEVDLCNDICNYLCSEVLLRCSW